ncbi:hypothetical protein AAC387_Pa01g2450 [Persea americana]
MPVLAAVVYFASLVRFYSATAEEDEHSDSKLVACLVVVAVEVVLPGSELVPKGLLASVADFCCLDFVTVGNP